jgi:carotenoid cleavage dioxygenase
MMHDFVVTQDHVVLYLTNMVADMDRIRAGGVHFSYDANTPCYMGVMRRGGDGKDLRWFTGQNLFCTHVMGGWSDGDKVTVDWDGGEGNQFPFFPSRSGPFDPAKSTGLLRRFTIDLSSRSNDRYQTENDLPEVSGGARRGRTTGSTRSSTATAISTGSVRGAGGGSSTTRRTRPSSSRCPTTSSARRPSSRAARARPRATATWSGLARAPGRRAVRT